MQHKYDLIKSLRLKKGLTQKQIADKLFIDRTTYSKFESGVTKIDIHRLQNIAKILDVGLEAFLPNTDDGNIKNFSKKDTVAKLLQFSIESLIYNSYTNETNKLETYPLSFEEYLIDEVLNPDFVVNSIIQDVKNYYSDDPEIRGELDLIYKEDEIELLKHKRKEELYDFAKNENNYELIWNILYQPFTYKAEEYQTAFNELILENHDIKMFFEFGLVTDRFLLGKWGKFMELKPEKKLLAKPRIEKSEIHNYLSSLKNLTVIESDIM